MDFNSLGLLILRVGFGTTMAIRHGLPKLLDFSNQVAGFPDPLGVGSTLSLSLTICAEFLCAILVVVGIFTRFVAFPLMVAMGVAFFIVHKGDPFQKKEMAFLYMMAFSTIFACGPGAFSADNLFRGVR